MILKIPLETTPRILLENFSINWQTCHHEQAFYAKKKTIICAIIHFNKLLSFFRKLKKYFKYLLETAKDNSRRCFKFSQLLYCRKRDE